MPDSASDNTLPRHATANAGPDSTQLTVVDDEGNADQIQNIAVDASGQPPHYLNSVDATTGQPIVVRVMLRKHQLEAALSGLPMEDRRARGDLELALSTIDAMLTGDLTRVPPVVVVDMSRWLERTKHLAESAVVAVVDPVTAPVSLPLEQTLGSSHAHQA